MNRLTFFQEGKILRQLNMNIGNISDEYIKKEGKSFFVEFSIQGVYFNLEYENHSVSGLPIMRVIEYAGDGDCDEFFETSHNFYDNVKELVQDVIDSRAEEKITMGVFLKDVLKW